ncbi:MAG: exodeoxyribonuclease VII large subunit [Thermacetogeniaceae bacterium]
MLRRIFRVGEIAAHIRDLLECDTLLSDVWVRGEVSNFKHHTSGHLYFTLKDEMGSLRCVMFRSRASFLEFLPVDGMSVVVRGYVSFYEREGNCQLYAEEIKPDGVGAFYLAYCLLKEKLEAEGLFSADNKKPIPFLPRKVGVVTSPNGAAWHDIVSVIRRRFPQMPIVLAPASVQGEQAPYEIQAALAALGRRKDIDVVIVGRGGGTLEELWAFNTEEVARAIFNMPIPVVSAVGHETDYSIADFVADLRAPTPSAAAEMVVPDRRELEQKLNDLYCRLLRAVTRSLRDKQSRIRAIAEHNLPLSAVSRLVLKKREVSFLERRLLEAIRSKIATSKSKIELLAAKLDGVSPLAILRRGYCLCCNPKTGRVIKSVRESDVGEMVDVVLKDGKMHCLVKEMRRLPHGGDTI